MSVLEAMVRAFHKAGAHDDTPSEPDAWRLQALNSQMRAALAEARRQGWKLVPVEATSRMKDMSGTPRAADVYRAMIAAAPDVEG